MRAKQKIVQGRGPSNINLGIFVCSLMFAGLHNQSPLSTMIPMSISKALYIKLLKPRINIMRELKPLESYFFSHIMLNHVMLYHVSHVITSVYTPNKS